MRIEVHLARRWTTAADRQMDAPCSLALAMAFAIACFICWKVIDGVAVFVVINECDRLLVEIDDLGRARIGSDHAIAVQSDRGHRLCAPPAGLGN